MASPHRATHLRESQADRPVIHKPDLDHAISTLFSTKYVIVDDSVGFTMIELVARAVSESRALGRDSARNQLNAMVQKGIIKQIGVRAQVKANKSICYVPVYQVVDKVSRQPDSARRTGHSRKGQ